ncbi:MAG: transcriptional repressor [bacterium]|nr:transcriptional repressor [bacterium]
MTKRNRKEQELFIAHLRKQQLKNTQQRQIIMKAFLAIENHISSEELSWQLKKEYPGIGYSTIYRTLRLLVEAGLAREIQFSDGITRFEHYYAHPHHDHLVCLLCGKSIEFYHPEIESLQQKIIRQYQFEPKQHRLEIYGYCKKCQGKSKQ